MDLVKNIFNETYNEFYLKWKSKVLSEKDVIDMANEAREISRKNGDIDLVRHITVNLATMLEQDYLNRGKCHE